MTVPRPVSRRRLVSYTLQCLLSLLLSLAAAEAFCRYIEPESQRLLAVRNQFADYRYHPKLGWELIPDRDFIFERSEFKTTIHSNHDSMRYRDVGPKHGLRIAVLGDSFTWGHGVEQQDRYTDLLEKATGVEILNFGVTAYGTLQYYLLMDKVLSFHPDVVIIATFPQNDMIDNLSNFKYQAYKPYAVLENGKLVLKGIPVPKITRFGLQLRPWYTSYALGRYLQSCFEYAFPNWASAPPSGAPAIRGETSVTEGTLYNTPQSPAAVNAALINQALLKAIKEKVEAAHAQMLIFELYGKADMTRNSFRDLITRQAKNLDIPLAILPPVPLEDFYMEDSHWRPPGHIKAANFLLPYIRQYMDNTAPTPQQP